jgi:hypothetical protein
VLGRLRRAGKGFGSSGGINAAAQRGSIFNGQALGANVAEDNGAIAQLDAPGGADFAFNLAGDDDILRGDGGFDAAVSAHGELGAGKADVPSTSPSMSRSVEPEISPRNFASRPMTVAPSVGII